MVDKSMAVTIAVSATDDDTDQLSLVYSGTVSDCTPESFGGDLTELSILSCTTDHMGLRFGSVTVEDPEQNLDTVSFTFDPCESGQVCEGGDPCDEGGGPKEEVRVEPGFNGAHRDRPRDHL